MKILIMADIHSNITAFEAVLHDAELHGTVDDIWNLGDLVGYGPDPHECIRLLKEICKVCIAGNHDLAAVSKVETSEFNIDAEAAIKWTSQQLSIEDKEYLSSLPLIIEQAEFTLVHGSPRDPIWEYLSSIETARENLPYFRTRYCMVGHRHIPILFQFNESQVGTIQALKDKNIFALGKGRIIFNPGSVGQPRDHNPLASYGIYDTDQQSLALHRVKYDITSVQQRMLVQGLPPALIDRLALGV